MLVYGQGLLLLAIGFSAATHYEDPNKAPGCGSDEQAIQVTGLAGDMCSPQCSPAGDCPTDVGPGVTAQPSCVLNSPSGDKFCALVCQPGAHQDAQCGTDASCKVIQGTGLCTFDDAPLPPASAHWAPLSSPTFEEQSLAIAVAFEPSGRVGWAGAGNNQDGADIIQSEDGGKTWARVFPNASTQPGLNLFLAAAAVSPTSAVVSGLLTQAYTADGTSFSASNNAFLSPAQDAQTLPSGGYALVTPTGVATSADGKWWKTFKTGASDDYSCRYGAFPTDQTWFVTGGTWPENSEMDLSQHVAVSQPSADARAAAATARTLELRMGEAAAASPPEGYYAAVFKTTDGGATWSVVYNQSNSGVYPNGIHCSDERHCVAALEGNSARVIVTNDGGATWNETMNDPDPKSSLMYVRMVSASEGWVSGGHMSPADFEGRFWHTVDGGKTWAKEAIKGLFIVSMNIVAPTIGFGVALTLQSGLQLLRYKSPQARQQTTLEKAVPL